MTLNALKKHYIQELSEIYSEGESLSILQILCEDLLHWTRTDFFIRDRDAFNHIEEEILMKSLENLKNNQPVQHITGIAHFYGHTFKVTPDTLIPRQETEELVDLIVKDHQRDVPDSIVDIGTGSGCIGLSLGLAFAKAKLQLIDVSQKSLEIAKENAASLHREQHTEFIQMDILSATKLPIADVIVSNPPYVRELEKKEIHNNVLDYDPELALFVSDEDPLVFYRKIMELSKPSLKQGGLLYFEINQYLNKEMAQLAEDQNLNHEILRDLNGNWRMMKCWITDNN